MPVLKQRIGATARRPGLECPPEPVQPRQRVLGPNPWLPWVEPPTRRPSGGSVQVFSAIIPTAGTNLPRLLACVSCLSNAAAHCDLEIVVVVCPMQNKRHLRDIRELLRHEPNVKVVGLEGPFNYPRSINEGIAACRDYSPWILLLNDDAFFTGEMDLSKLAGEAKYRRWGCVGPNLVVTGQKPAQRAYPLSEPIVGACALWSREWLDRIGEFDERFGEGYGHDESDHTRRGRNMGMTWGIVNDVIVEHENHATFGDDVCKPGSPTYDINVAYWKQKWGDVPSWYGAPYWTPLPGVQVIIAGHNVEPWLKRCLDSVEEVLEGCRWVLGYADDGSTDNSLIVARKHKSSADVYHAGSYSKSTGAGQAKNRALAMMKEFRRDYPAVLLMDADDVMLMGRKELLVHAVDRGLSFVHGNYVMYSDRHPNGMRKVACREQQRDGWLSPCTTVIHSSLIPEDSRMFREDLKSQEDADLFYRWYKQGIISEPINVDTHEYHLRPGSVMTSRTENDHNREWKAIKEQADAC